MLHSLYMKESQKICYIITKSNLGGAQKYVFELATKAHEEGHEVSVITGGNGPLIELLKKNNITVYQIQELGRDVNLISDMRSFAKIYSYLRKNKPDVLHLNSSKIGGVGAVIGRLLGIKNIIFTIHGWAFNENRNFIQKIIIKKLYAITMLLCHKSIAVSQNTKKQFGGNFFYSWLGKKIIVIPNSIKPFTLIERTEARKKISEMTSAEINDDILIGIFAELHPIKGHKYLIDAFDKLHVEHANCKLLLFGDGEIRNEIVKQIKNLGLENYVYILGFVFEAPKLLSALDIFVLSSISEASPLSIHEAGYAGLPIIASNVGGVSEIIEDNQSGFLTTPKDTDDLYKKMKTLVENENLRKEFSRNIKESIHNKFSFEKMYEETFRTYFK